jgi:hypothetical protein
LRRQLINVAGRAQEPFVGVVGPRGQVRLRPIAVASHDGQRVGVERGLDEGELVALNLGRSVADGDLLEPVPVGMGGAATPVGAR